MQASNTVLNGENKCLVKKLDKAIFGGELVSLSLKWDLPEHLEGYESDDLTPPLSPKKRKVTCAKGLELTEI